MTPSEEFVAKLCQKSFLPFWSFASPLGKKGKELCDMLVVCGNDIIMISVKDIKVTDHADPEVQSQRWQRDAIEGSVKQIYGAERFLEQVTEILVKDREFEIALPDKDSRQIHRIAIAFGGGNQFPLETGDFGKGFVHVFDEESTFTVISELDTITDFVRYLKAKEHFLRDRLIIVPKEVDFLALYIQTGLIFDGNPDSVLVDEGIWDSYAASGEYRRWTENIKKSYLWDEIVVQLFENLKNGKHAGAKHSDMERATRIICCEPRINRMELALVLKDAMEKGLRGRMLRPLGDSEHCYVFMPLSQKNWDSKESELQLRCLIARKENPTSKKVIGLGIGTGTDGVPLFDLAFFDLPALSGELLERIEQAKNELGYFSNPVAARSSQMRS